MLTVKQFTHRGIHFLNEDALVINERASLYGVLDGVSSIVPYLSDKKETGGYIAAQTVKNSSNHWTELNSLRSMLRQQTKS